MNSISPFINNTINIVTQVLKNSAAQISQWANHSVRFIQLIPQQMQQNSYVAFAVIATTNTIFFLTIRSIVKHLDQRLDNQAKPLNLDQRTIKHILLNGLILGGSVISANLLLSKITQYSLSKSVLATITTAAIVGHILLNQLEKYLAKGEKSINLEDESVLESEDITEENKEAETIDKKLEDEIAQKKAELEEAQKKKDAETQEQLKAEEDLKKAEAEAAEDQKKKDAKEAQKKIEESLKKKIAKVQEQLKTEEADIKKTKAELEETQRKKDAQVQEKLKTKEAAQKKEEIEATQLEAEEILTKNSEELEKLENEARINERKQDDVKSEDIDSEYGSDFTEEHSELSEHEEADDELLGNLFDPDDVFDPDTDILIEDIDASEHTDLSIIEASSDQTEAENSEEAKNKQIVVVKPKFKSLSPIQNQQSTIDFLFKEHSLFSNLLLTLPIPTQPKQEEEKKASLFIPTSNRLGMNPSLLGSSSAMTNPFLRAVNPLLWSTNMAAILANMQWKTQGNSSSDKKTITEE